MLDPTEVTSLSALGVWRFTIPILNETAYVVYDLSGYVAWKSSKPEVAVVLNNANYRPQLRREKLRGNYVSPYYAPVLWSRAEPFQATAVWAQGVEDTTGQSCEVQPVVSTAAQNPAFLRNVTISPGQTAFRRAPGSPLNFYATGGYTSREQRDLSRDCDWYAYLASSSDPSDVSGPLPARYGTMSATGSLQLTPDVSGKRLVVSISVVHRPSAMTDVTEVVFDY